jgi:cell wall-associated NlpC family hydrolase
MTIENVIQEAKTWIGTPYRKNARIKGVGVDCSMLLAEVYERAGAIEHIDPIYAADWHLHHNEEKYIDWLLSLGYEIDSKPQPGDVVVWRFGRTFSHGAIVVEWPIVIHAYMMRPVEFCDTSVDSQLRWRPRRVFRLRGIGDGR